MKRVFFVILGLCFLCVLGCKTTHPQKSNLSAGAVKKTIKVGETTQAEGGENFRCSKHSNQK